MSNGGGGAEDFGALDAMVDGILSRRDAYRQPYETGQAQDDREDEQQERCGPPVHAGRKRGEMRGGAGHWGNRPDANPCSAPAKTGGPSPATLIPQRQEITRTDTSPIDELVERILSGEHVSGGGDDSHLERGDTTKGSSKTRSGVLYQQRPQPQRVASASAAAAFFSQPSNSSSGGGMRAGPERGITGTDTAFALSASSTHRSRSGKSSEQQQQQQQQQQHKKKAQEDALLRRFALWEERKNAKKLKAVYEALLAEAAACTFQPRREPEALLPEKVFASSLLARRSSSEPQPGVGAFAMPPELSDRRGNKNNSARSSEWDEHAGVDDDDEDGGRRRKLSTATWGSLLAPSALYADNKAWGFDDYVARMARVRQQRERQREESEEAKRRLYDVDTFTRAPTRTSPFDLSCYDRPTETKHVATSAAAASADGNKGNSGRALTSFSPARTKFRGSSSSDPRAESDADVIIEVEEVTRGIGDAYYCDVARTLSPSARRRLAEKDTFATIGAAVRQQILFSDETSQQLEKATSAVKECFLGVTE